MNFDISQALKGAKTAVNHAIHWIHHALDNPASWIVIGMIVGAIIATLVIRAHRAQFAVRHLRALLSQDLIQGIKYDSRLKQTFVLAKQGDNQLPRRPYKEGPPATHFEGFTPREIRAGARRLTTEAFVHVDKYRQKRRGPWSWSIKPEHQSPAVQKIGDGTKKPADFVKPSSEQSHSEARVH